MGKFVKALALLAFLWVSCSEVNNPNNEVGLNGTSSVSSSSHYGQPPYQFPGTPTFTMSFNTNGGSPSAISPITLDSGTAAFGDFPNNPAKEGYTFDGWLDESRGIVYTEATKITGNATLTAKWTLVEPGRATVSFYTDGGTPSAIEPVTLDTGKTLGAASFPADPKRAGYTFEGWFDPEGTQYTATTPINKNVALTAKWLIKSYTVTFNANGGIPVAINPVSVDSGSALGTNIPANPTKPDSAFAGWFDSNGAEYTAQSIITGDLALAAKWEKPSTSSSSNKSSSSIGSSSSSSGTPTTGADFTETANGVSFNMVYAPGGTFTLGCEKSSGCPEDAKPVSGVRMSNYFIGKTEVSTALWNAVMGITCSGYMCNTAATTSHTSMDWYQAHEFACKLSNLTGRKYHMTTEAEWEYAAKNHLSKLEKIGDGNEWAYNTWNSTHSGGTDPIGPGGPIHNQKTRRDATETVDHITGRLIRSIDGIGPALRLALSAEMDYPPNMVPPCNIHAPVLGGEPENSYRDPRWVTGSGTKWTATGDIKIGSFELRAWEDGTARLGSADGQWFTSNNIAFVFVPNTGSRRKFAYIFLDETQGSLITDQGYATGYIGRIVKESASSVSKPTVSNLKSGAELAAAAGDDYKMVDMANIPAAAKKQDSRLLDGPNQGWFQDNHTAGGQHHYRKDVDSDAFRFTVNQLTGPNAGRTLLATGSWFTVNNTFLRITQSNGYTADYLYTVVDGTFYHNSFMAYERADFRMFKKTDNFSSVFTEACGDLCKDEIPKGGTSIYDNSYWGEKGKSTFKPAPCPAGGCK